MFVVTIGWKVIFSHRHDVRRALGLSDCVPNEKEASSTEDQLAEQ